MKKILHVYKTSLPQTIGGVEIFIDTLCRGTAQFGFNNTVLSVAENPSVDPIVMPGYRVVQCKQNLNLASTNFSFSAFVMFRRLLQEADLVHYHFPNPFGDLLQLLNKIKKPTVVSYHSDIIKQKHLLKFYKPLMFRFLNSIDRVVAGSDNYFSSSEVLQQFREKTRVIPLGLDARTDPVDAKRLQYWQERLPPTFFLFVGALRYYKGLHLALDAIANTNFQLVIAGNGGVEKDLKKQAMDLGLQNVHFLGSVSEEDKAALLQLCYAFLFPSHLRSESYGLSLLEAAMHRKPLISCEIGTGTSFINQDQQTGLVVLPRVDALRTAMQYLVENPAHAEEFGRNAQARYWQLFTADQQTQAYVALYQEMLAGVSV